MWRTLDWKANPSAWIMHNANNRNRILLIFKNVMGRKRHNDKHGDDVKLSKLQQARQQGRSLDTTAPWAPVFLLLFLLFRHDQQKDFGSVFVTKKHRRSLTKSQVRVYEADSSKALIQSVLVGYCYSKFLFWSWLIQTLVKKNKKKKKRKIQRSNPLCMRCIGYHHDQTIVKNEQEKEVNQIWSFGCYSPNFFFRFR